MEPRTSRKWETIVDSGVGSDFDYPPFCRFLSHGTIETAPHLNWLPQRFNSFPLQKPWENNSPQRCLCVNGHGLLLLTS